MVLILIYVFLKLRDGTEVSSLCGHHTSLEGLHFSTLGLVGLSAPMQGFFVHPGLC